MAEHERDAVRRKARLLGLLKDKRAADVKAFLPYLLIFAARAGAELSEKQLAVLGRVAQAIGYDDRWTKEQCESALKKYFALHPVDKDLARDFERFVRSEIAELSYTR